MPHALSPGSSPPVIDDSMLSEGVPDAAEDESAKTADVEMGDAKEPGTEEKTNLDDMFDDDEEEDEFNSSAPFKQEESSHEEQ